jgi:hypothetical protein
MQLEWTEEGVIQMECTLRIELTKDWDEIYSRMEQFANVSRGFRMDHPSTAKDRTERHLEQEFTLLVMRADRTRLTLIERLAADRYRAVAGAWRKAHDLLDQSQP